MRRTFSQQNGAILSERVSGLPQIAFQSILEYGFIYSYKDGNTANTFDYNK